MFDKYSPGYILPYLNFLIDNLRFIVKKAHLIEDKIAIEQIQPEGKQAMSFENFKHGYCNLLTKLPKWVKI